MTTFKKPKSKKNQTGTAQKPLSQRLPPAPPTSTIEVKPLRPAPAPKKPRTAAQRRIGKRALEARAAEGLSPQGLTASAKEATPQLPSQTSSSSSSSSSPSSSPSPSPSQQKKKKVPAPKPPRPAPTSELRPTRCGTVALVGRPNVGKSSLLNAILGQKIAATTHKPQTTRRALRGVYSDDDTQIIFVDTPGLHEAKGGLFSFMLDEAKDTAAAVDVLAFLVEADARGIGIAPADVAALKTLEGKVAGQPMLLIINKIDVLRTKGDLLPLLQLWSGNQHFPSFSALIPVSAHKKDGLREFIAEIRKHLPEAPFLMPKDSITDQSERDIAAELIREKVMLELHEEIPYRAAVIVELFDESRREDERKPLVHIAANIVVEKDSQKAMVIGKGGQRIKAIGQRARAELENLLDCQVHLELFAKVEPGWTESSQGLRKLGYVRSDR